MGDHQDWASKVPEISVHPKEPISIRVDKDVLNYFKSTGKGYQTRMNAVLRAFMQHHTSEKGHDNG